MAAPIFQTFQKASFDGIEFPYVTIAVKGGIRYHVHEYPHSPGGDVEKIGRKLYTSRFRVPCHDLPGSYYEQLYPDFYPNKVAELRDRFEDQLTSQLVIPGIGSMLATCTSWDSNADMAQALSGQDWDLEFIEDVEAGTASLKVFNLGVLPSQVEELQARATAHGFKPNIFDKLQDAITVFDGGLGTADMYTRLAAGKIEGIAQICSKLDRETKEFLDPMNSPVLEALKDVWASAVDLAENIPGIQGGQLSYFRVPKIMSIGQVATKLYGSADRGVDIMQINPIDDPFAIPAGFQISYVKAA